MTRGRIIETVEVEEEESVSFKSSDYWLRKAEDIRKQTKDYDLEEMCKQCIKKQYAQGIKDKDGKPKLTISCVGLENTRSLKGEAFYNYLKNTQTEEDMDLIEQGDSSIKWMSANIKDQRIFSPRPYQKMIAACSAKKKVLRMGRRCVEANEYIECINKNYKAKHLWHLYKHHKKMPEIIAYDEKTHKLVKTNQYVIVPNGINTVYKVTTLSGKNTTITEEHPLLVYSNKQYGFKSVFEISVGEDSILTLDGVLDTVVSIQEVGPKQTYHLSVIKYETFATKGGLIHHNTGKALDVRTEIPTPKGWVTMGELKEGDKVFDNKGKVCNVTYATEYQYDRVCYDISFDNGDKIVADAEHQWTVYEVNINTKTTTKKTITTQYMVNNNGNIYSIPLTKPVNYSYKVFKVSPYLYGSEVVDSLDPQYLYGSVDQRQSLLKGLLQTHSNGTNSLVISEKIKDSVKELLCSLGYKASIRYKDNRVVLNYTTNNLIINKITKVETRPVKCITVDSDDSLYLVTRNYIVTHNTFVMTLGLLHRLLTRQGAKGYYRVLMVAPMDTMIAEVAEQLRNFCNALPENPIQSSKQTPIYEIQFSNGAVFKGITAGASGAKAARGKGADLLYVDECLPKGTMIKTQERGSLPIEEIKKGEKILSFDVKTNTTVYRKVTEISYTKSQVVYTYTTISGRKIRCTPNHPLLTSEGWKDAEKAKDVATIKTRAKSSVFYETIVSGKYTSTEEVYNFAVEGTQNYIADGFVVHNCDFLRPQDLTSVLGVLMDSKHTEFWASSTPIGESNLYNLQKDPAFKEFHFPSFVSPEYTQESDDLNKGQMTDSGYIQEVCAEFGADDGGVYPLEFLNKYIEDEVEGDTLNKYRSLDGKTRTTRDQFIFIMGVDWNHDKVGTRIFIIAFDKATNLYHILDKETVSAVGWTQTKAVDKIVQLNRKYDVDHIYVDEGFGIAQASVLRKFGLEQYGKVPPNHPDIKLSKVVAVNFRSTLVIHDPIKGEELRKQTKQFIVENSVNLLRNGSLRLHAIYDSDIISQMKNYVIKSKSASGLKTYTFRDKKIGDHDLDAFNIGLFGFTQEYPDYFSISPVSNLRDTAISETESVVLSVSSSIIINTKQSLMNNKFRKGFGNRPFKNRRSW